VTRFRADSTYMDDRNGVPLRFLTEANLTQVIRRQEQQVTAEIENERVPPCVWRRGGDSNARSPCEYAGLASQQTAMSYRL
jgi:hypothetical protein